MMRSILQVCFVMLVIFSFVFSTAEARRFGGGRSIGAHRTISTPAALSKPMSALNSVKRNWFGAIAGLAAGALLASLFMGHGFLNGALAWGAIALVLVLLFKFIAGRKAQPDMNNAQNHAQSNQSNWRTPEAPRQDNFYQSASANSFANAPAGLAEQDFLRTVKSQFIRLQAAYDKKDLNDIREFTTPQMFAEIQMQLQERGQAENFTEVLYIDARALDLQNDNQDSGASVQFKGEVREERNQPPVQIDEIWHFKKDVYSGKWLVSGIQQS